MKGFFGASLLFFTSGLQANAFFITNQNKWDEKTQMVIANCPSFCAKSNQHSLFFKEASGHVFLDAILILHQDKNYIYAISSEAKFKGSLLYRFEFGQDKADIVFTFPFQLKTAYFSSGTVGKEMEIKRLLIVTGQAVTEDKEILKVFDVSTKKDSLDPIQGIELAQSSLKQLGRAIFVPWQDNKEAFLFFGRDSQGALQVFFWNTLKWGEVYKTTQNSPIKYVSVLDTEQQGKPNSMVALDEAGNLWKFNLKQSKVCLSLFSSQKHQTKIDFQAGKKPVVVVKNLEKPGLWYYFLTQKNQEPPVLTRVAEEFQMDTQKENTLVTEFLCKGDCLNFYLRAGQLILIPSIFSNDLQTKGLALSPVRHTELLFNWQVVSPMIHFKSPIQQTKMLWDPKLKQEFLLSLNQACELKILKATLNNNDMRFFWRKRDQ